MSNDLRFDGRVAIVTGAGNGLGRSHALLLASRGAKVVVNDLGGSAHGTGQSTSAADKVVAEIKAAGGEAVANYDSVENGDKIVKTALDAFGRIDIVINNAGILRDVSFQKMTQDDWDLVYRVHVLGAFRVTHAAWNHMREQGYGRIVFTASAAGIYGNFGQANYSAAKLAQLGMSNTLAIEGKKKNVIVNTIAPIAGSRMTETVLPKELIDALKPEYVSPLVAYLCHESCEDTGGLYEVGGGYIGKLRWQRTIGKSFKLGRNLTPELVQKAWGDITDFEKPEYPRDITASMQPVLGNLNSKSKGGNEFIDVDAALGYELPPVESRYDERDMALYALGVGAAANPLDTSDLQYVYELHPEGFRTLPSYAVVPPISAILDLAKRGQQAPGLNYGFERILHGEQYTEIKRPLPPHAKLTHKARIKDIFDKGKNAVVVTEVKSYDESGRELALNEVTMVVRGAGGWGGDRGPSDAGNNPPDRAPDATVTERINENQALLYRLSGDWNPLHADPQFAANFGFPKPILHGLCTFGYATRHVIKSFCNNDPRLFKSIKVRMADSVFPGETLITEMWKESDGKIVFRCKVKERDKVVISNAAIELFKEVPKDEPAPAPAKAAQAAPAPSAAASDKVTSGDIFVAIRDHIERNPDLATKVQTVFQFKLTGPESVWTVDLKNGKGSVSPGAGEKPDCTLELSDADFLDMTSGAADPQKLYFGGKLKISGNVMASQKLTFLKKMDPEAAKAAIAKARASGAGAGTVASSAPAAAPASDTVTSGDIFVAIRDHIERSPDLAGKVATVFQFKLTGPESVWTIDLKNGKGSVAPGAGEKPDCTLELSDEDFLAMTSGAADPQKLYFAGKLKISGNLMASQKLTFLKKMDPEAAKTAIAKARAAGGAGASAAAASTPAASKGAQAGNVFKAVSERIAKTPGLVGEVGAVIQFVITDPDAAWVVDLKNGAGSVREGRESKADTTVKLADEDLLSLVKGESLRDLYQHGKVRVDGDMRAAHKLGFLKAVV